MTEIDKALPTFRESLASAPASLKERAFADRLQQHGEAQITLSNGVVHSIHLGDQGMIADGVVTYIDREGQRHNIFVDQIVTINTHLGYAEP